MNKNKIIILIVGGAVRDLLLGKNKSDTDYLVASGSSADFISRFPEALPVGKSYPVFYLYGSEFTFPREGGDSFDERVDKDLASRDLTINALALGPDGELYAHPEALKDISERILRPASATSFLADPLRIFRVASFYARFPTFTPAPELLTQMKECAAKNKLREIFPDRIGMEVRKALSGDKPGNFLRLLSEAECLNPWFKFFAEAANIPAGPVKYHGNASVLDHTTEVMDKLAGNSLNCWAALCHDLGKTRTPADKWPTHHAHDSLGRNLAIQLGKMLRLPKKYIIAGEIAAGFHMIVGRYNELRNVTKVDLLMKLHTTSTLSLMRELCHADRGQDVLASAQTDLDKILKVTLEKKDRDQGADSGKKLRNLRAHAL